MKFFLSALLALGLMALAARATEFPTMNEAFQSIGFDPAAPGNLTFAAASDLHFGHKSEELPPELVADLNGMQPLPAFLLFDGDNVHVSISFGQVPSAEEQAKGKEVYQRFKTALQAFTPALKIELALGNHDTYPGEDNVAIFRSAFPKVEPYGAFDAGGIHFVRLNGGASGDLDPQQAAWLEADLKTVPSEKSIVIFVHQPPFNKLPYERGIGEALQKTAADRTGEVWVIAGHVHQNKLTVFQLPKTRLFLQTVTRCGTGIFGDKEGPGYWIYGVSQGKIAARVFRKFKGGFRAEPAPDAAKALPIPQLFGNMNVLWKLMVGAGDRQYLVKANAADVVSWWTYIKELVYRLPVIPGASHLGIVGCDFKPDDSVSLSLDGQDWQSQELPQPARGVYAFPLPEVVRNSAEVQVRIVSANGKVGGFAFLDLMTSR